MSTCILLAGADSVRKNRGLSLSAGPFGAIKSVVLIDVGFEALVEWWKQSYAGVRRYIRTQLRTRPFAKHHQHQATCYPGRPQPVQIEKQETGPFLASSLVKGNQLQLGLFILCTPTGSTTKSILLRLLAFRDWSCSLFLVHECFPAALHVIVRIIFDFVLIDIFHAALHGEEARR